MSPNPEAPTAGPTTTVTATTATTGHDPAPGGLTAGPRLVLTVLAALGAWEVGEVVSSWLLVTVLAPGVPLVFTSGGGLQPTTPAALLLRVAVVLGVAAPTALLLLRPVLGYRDARAGDR